MPGKKDEIHAARLKDEGKILIVDLARGQVGEDTASLLGALLVTTVTLAAFSRAEIDAAERRPFFVYVDEFQSFTTRSLAKYLISKALDRVRDIALPAQQGDCSRSR
jgi:hypothetical protein